MIDKSGFAATALAASMVVAFANGAAAEGMYASFIGGYSALADSGIDLNANTRQVTLHGSYVAGGAIGYNFKGPLRVEGEVTYQNYDVDEINAKAVFPIVNPPGPFVDGNGDVDVLGFSINGIYDFKPYISTLIPYIGAGAGVIYAEANDVESTGRSILNESAVAPTALAMLGVGYNPDDSVTLTVGYRFQWVGVLDGSHIRTGGTEISADTDNDQIFIHSFTVGLRFNF